MNSLLSTCDFVSTLDGILSHSDTLCILRYEPSSGQGAAVKIGQDWSYKKEEEKEMVASDKFGERTGAAGPHAEPSGPAGPITGSNQTTTPSVSPDVTSAHRPIRRTNRRPAQRRRTYRRTASPRVNSN